MKISSIVTRYISDDQEFAVGFILTDDPKLERGTNQETGFHVIDVRDAWFELFEDEDMGKADYGLDKLEGLENYYSMIQQEACAFKACGHDMDAERELRLIVAEAGKKGGFATQDVFVIFLALEIMNRRTNKPKGLTFTLICDDLEA